jgi:malonyl CoA-acyl carrier protein transacylase/SAM-dependent methyltransferase
MMAPDGRSKSFDAGANGFVRGEGCGVVVLKRYSEALRDGDRILALIRGSAVNQDGRSSGLTAPNGVAQEALLRQALANAGLASKDIDYIEAHGTGTALGDPIEAHALAAVYGPEREPSQPLVIGSVKTNVGHLEAAAGVAGLIKTVLSLEHQFIPQHLHFHSMNPHIDWGSLAVEIPVQGRDWPRGKRVRRAGISSFGFSGTNAHVIVEEAPLPTPRQAEWQRDWHILALSARTPAALDELTERYRQELRESTADVGDICFTANAGRTHFEERTFYVGKDRAQLLSALERPSPRGRKEGTPGVAFLFSGQGAQYAGMGRELYDSQPVFRQALDRCAEILRAELGEPLLEVLWGSRSELLGQTAYTQPALFAVEWSLAELWRSWGVEPAMVAGHSVGEYVAATVAGVMTLEAGLQLIAARGRLMQACAGEGVMSAVRASAARVQPALRGLESRVSLGAVNAPESVVISGYGKEVEEVERRLRAEGVECKRLAVSHGFHSPQMDEMQAAFAQLAAQQQYRSPAVKWVSAMTGKLVQSEGVPASYWPDQVRQPVCWAQAMETLEAEQAAVYLEVGPGTTLLGLGRQCVEPAERVWAPSLRQGKQEWEQMLDSLGKIYLRGVDIDWDGYDRGYLRQRVALPTYPFQRRHYWIEADGPSVLGTDPDLEWSSIHESVSRQADHGGLNLDIASYPERWAALDVLAAEYISRAFHSLDLYQRPGERHSAETLIASRSILPIYQKLMNRWLQHLAANGLLYAQDEWYTATEPLRPRNLETLCDSARLFSSDPIFEYFTACGPVLADVITGKLSAIETLFPRGEFSRAEGVYERHPMSAYFASLARAALEGLLRSRPTRALRIVEIGGGTGATASALLPVLRGQVAVYHFTDVSAAFLRHAERKFAAYPFVRYQQLDIERDCTSQDFAPGGFDVVVATNVLHATTDVRKALERATSLLAAGGLLVVCEVTECFSWLETTEALMPGWQAFEDDLRGDVPLLPLSTWTRLFKEANIQNFAAFPADGSPAKILGQHFFVARAPGVADSSHTSLRRAGGNAAFQATPTHNVPQELAFFDVPAGERHGVLVELIRRLLAEMLRFDSPEQIDRKRRFMELGVDSLIAIELRHHLQSALRLQQPLSATVVFDYPTIDSLADHLEHDVLDMEGSREPQLATFPAIGTSMADRADELAKLDESDVEALLLAKLELL